MSKNWYKCKQCENVYDYDMAEFVKREYPNLSDMCPKCCKATQRPVAADVGYDQCEECHTIIDIDDPVCPVCFP